MAGKHRKRRGAHARIPEQQQRRPRGAPVGMIDAQTHIEHLVTDESVRAHRHTGRYPAECGAEVLAASLTDPGRGRCEACHQRWSLR